MENGMRVFVLVLSFLLAANQTYAQNLPINDQPLSDYSDLYNTYDELYEKSEYETQDEYEGRIEKYFETEVVRFFDIDFDSYYDAEKQTLYFWGDRYTAADVDFDLPSERAIFEITPEDSLFDYNFEIVHNIIASNPDTFGLSLIEYPEPDYSFDVLLYFALQIDSTTAQSIRDYFKIRIGMKFNHNSGGIADTDLTRDPLYNEYLQYYILGELKVITLYDSSNDEIYSQNKIIQQPIANAGSDQTAIEGDIVTLDGSKSADTDDGIVSYEWFQIKGQKVSLSDSAATKPTFIAPEVDAEGEQLYFQLKVLDKAGLQSTDDCVVLVSSVDDDSDNGTGDNDDIGSDNETEDSDDSEDGEGVVNEEPECPTADLLGEKDEHLTIVRRFRDEILINTETGNKLVEIYYKNGNTITKIFDKSPIVRRISKQLLEASIPIMELIIAF